MAASSGLTAMKSILESLEEHLEKDTKNIWKPHHQYSYIKTIVAM